MINVKNAVYKHVNGKIAQLKLKCTLPLNVNAQHN